MVKANVLVLNKNFFPLYITNWENAILLYYKGIAEVVSHYDDVLLRTPKSSQKCPAVIRLIKFSRPSKKLKFFKKANKRNIYNHYGGVCVYCGKKLTYNEFTKDHLIATSKGGDRHSWNNLVCSCLNCNSKKSNKTLQESGMKLLTKINPPEIEDYITRSINTLKECDIDNEYWKPWINRN